MGDRLDVEEEAICLLNLAAVLRQAAEAMRLFSDTDKLGGCLSKLTALSLRVDDDANALEDLVRRENTG